MWMRRDFTTTLYIYTRKKSSNILIKHFYLNNFN
nr:MAG TPA: hypothetical protein [Caudoviricetes sp.]